MPTESFSPLPPPAAVVYNVTAVKAKRIAGDNCVVARMIVTNNGLTPLEQGTLTGVPSPFKLVNAKGVTVRSVAKSLYLDGNVLPGHQGTGVISLCAPSMTSGSRVTLHHGKRKWKVGFTKPKPKPKPKLERKPKQKRPAQAPRPTSNANNGGGYPGYTGPRCYAPGGKTWKPC
ncbi:hypothetical protein BZB76_3889 [Actinomadura pelletieri DSM 43383]|uniref:Uncharacterized protein n=2 Tax=Actinomadura pelletieri TaxID=111805 RepID=A0A495QKX5_9ACTN|nr:hypothetical protein BZB76_3889 [Actinomadura pelletieri DSM 43383]